jgi:hypothetical protein
MTEKGRITHAVVEFITSVQWHDFPVEAVDLAKRCLIDGLAVMLAGATTRGSAMLREYVRASGGAPEATVFAPDSFRTSAASAALANASSGHAMDWDGYAVVFDSRPRFRPPDASHHASAGSVARLGRTASRFGTVVRCGFPDGFRGGMQNG